MNRFIENHKWNIIFWAVNIFGWLGMSGVGFFFTPNVDGYRESAFFMVSLILGVDIGLLSTGLLRAYLKRNISLEQFSLKDLLKIVLSIVVIALVHSGLNIGSGLLLEKFDLIQLFFNEEIKVPEIYKKYGIGFVILNAFIVIIGWTVLYLGIKIMLKFNNDRIEKIKMSNALKQAQLNTLKGQINPHFMFNSLNNIRGLMLEDVEKSREMLTKLSEILRYSLVKNDVNAIALEEELEMVYNYIALSKIQLEDRLHYIEEIAADVKAITIPPMIIQLLIENAIKHGVSTLKEGGEIKLKISKTEKELLIEVKNSGQLIFTKESTRLGLKNIKQRIQLLYGMEAHFSLTEEEKNVVALIKIPLQ